MTPTKNSKSKISIIRIIARIWSVISVGFFLIFIIGHVFFPNETDGLPTPIDFIAMIFFPTGVMAGMIVGWKNERLGGFITVFSLLMFFILILIPRQAFQGIPLPTLLAGPGFLFLWCAHLSKGSPEKKK